jgi:hypothetical protein
VNSQLLLLINFLIVTGLVMYFLTARSKRKQSGLLNISNRRETPEKQLQSQVGPPELSAEIPNQARSVTEAKFDLKPETAKEPVKVDPKDVKIEEPSFAKKEIVYFVYNGHEWEAHEVLGLPSGVSLPEATQHYQNLIKTSDPSTFEFYDAAFAAILKLKRNKW